MKYRISYKKTGRLIYVSHLDMQRTFQRLFRRAGLDLEFSQGFNPHPLLSYTPPVPLFAASDDEYLDVQLTGSHTDSEIFTKLPPLSPEGLVIKSVKKLDENDRPLSETFKKADYVITLNVENISAESLNDFYLSSETINVEKLSKKKQLKIVDIKPMIYDFRAENTKDGIEISCTLSLANESLLNPFVLVKALCENKVLPESCKTKRIFKQKAY